MKYRDFCITNNYTVMSTPASLDDKIDDSRGHRRLEPDYLVSTAMRGVNYTIMSIEAKTPRNHGRGQLWDDIAKLGNEMKLCLDTILLLGPSKPVVLHGVVIKGKI
ncbi:hypothetical protein BGZ73_008849 [Actinomortierella ambigua]|nr:hypothetical protein BGZ73_008849 [Actinomortierella ambigua]